MTAPTSTWIRPEHESTGATIEPQVASPSPFIVNFALWLLCAVLVFGGFWVMSMSTTLPESFAAWGFAAGVLIDAAGLWLAFTWIPSLDERRAAKQLQRARGRGTRPSAGG